MDLVLFSVRDSVNESTGFVPFQLVFGHEVREPLKVVKEAWLNENHRTTPLAAYVKNFREKLHSAWKVAFENLKAAQVKMMSHYDKSKKVQSRKFNIGDQVLVLLPVLGGPLQSRYEGPYRVLEKICHYVCACHSRPTEEDSAGAC